MNEDTLNHYLKEITSLKRKTDKMNTDNPASLMEKIELLSKMLVYIGSVSAYVDEQYEYIYGNRKYEKAKSYVSHSKDKDAMSEIDIVELRKEESRVYGDKMRWRNAFETTKEQINVLKMKMRVNFNIKDGI